MKRKILLPDFPGSPFEGWTRKFIHKHYWKFHSIVGSFEDAMASSVVVYYECRTRYGDTVDNAAHFMALYQRVLYSRMIKWSCKATQERQALRGSTMVVHKEFSYLDADEYLIDHSKYSPRGEFNYGSVAVKIRDGSKELQTVVNLICRAPEEVLRTLRRDVQDGVKDGFAFFQRAVEFCGYSADSAPALRKELENLLA